MAGFSKNDFRMWFENDDSLVLDLSPIIISTFVILIWAAILVVTHHRLFYVRWLVMI
jgi:hypothetical protein